nr:unnamed protein product [Digitaria exilis]
MAIGGAASCTATAADDGSATSLPGLEHPLLHAYGEARSKEPAEPDHEAQSFGPEPSAGASFARTCFNGLNALSGKSPPSCCNLAFVPIGELAFGRGGRLVASAFLYAELYLVAIGFLVLEGDNLDKLFPGTSLGVLGVVVSGKQLFVVLVALVILPTTWLRSLAVLAYVSASGVLASAVVVVCVLWAAVADGVGFTAPGTRMINVGGLPTALGLYTFCYCGHAIFPTLCNSMKEKEKFSRVLVICFAACTLNYGSMAILGYLMYGDDVQSQVTLNLPEGKISSKLAIYTTLINPFSKYALMVTPLATAIEERLLAGNKRSVNLLIRTLLVVSTVVVALAVPFFGHLMALVGSLLSVMASMILPCVFYFKIFGVARRGRAEVALIAAIIVLGSLVAATGTYSSLKKIIHEF